MTVQSIRTGFTEEDLPSPRHWRTSELAVLDRHYSEHGAAGVHLLLPHRTRNTIKVIARQRGLRFARPPGGRSRVKGD